MVVNWLERPQPSDGAIRSPQIEPACVEANREVIPQQEVEM
jgi:hypothetical protein